VRIQTLPEMHSAYRPRVARFRETNSKVSSVISDNSCC